MSKFILLSGDRVINLEAISFATKNAKEVCICLHGQEDKLVLYGEEANYIWAQIKSQCVAECAVVKSASANVAKPAIATNYLPPNLGATQIYILEQNDRQSCVVMQCPCGCGDVLRMNLLEERSPRWELTSHNDGTISLSPLTDKPTGCRSRFSLQYGLPVWIRQGDR